MSKETFTAKGASADATNAVGRSARNTSESVDKDRQLAIILKNNHADDVNMPGHAWIRSKADIRTFREAMDDAGLTEDDDMTPDFKASDVRAALKSGKVTVYSSYPIRNGIFVTPSRMEAQNYAGSGRVYSQTVRLSDVAWIDGLQGQLAKYR